MENAQDLSHGDQLENLGRGVVQQVVYEALELDRLEIQYLTEGTYQLIVHERGQHQREPVVVS